jgi:hypothetical protein
MLTYLKLLSLNIYMDSFVLSDSEMSSDTDDEIIEMNVMNFGSIVNKKPKELLFNKIEFNSYKMSKDLKVSSALDSTTLDSTVYNME